MDIFFRFHLWFYFSEVCFDCFYGHVVFGFISGSSLVRCALIAGIWLWLQLWPVKLISSLYQSFHIWRAGKTSCATRLRRYIVIVHTCRVE